MFSTRARSILAVFVVFAVALIQVPAKPVSAKAFDGRIPLSGRIVFVSTRDGDAEIYTMAPNGSGQTRLTTSPAAERFPTWSPDGSKIAYLRSLNGTVTIMMMHADGSDQMEVATLPVWGVLDWSPDGGRLLFEINQRIGSIGIDGSDLIYHSPANSQAGTPAWSPDGQKIAFSRSPLSHPPYAYSQIFTMNVDGSDLRMLSRSGDYTSPGSPSWSPNGAKIVFAGLIDDGMAPNGLSLMNSDGTDPRQLIWYDLGEIECPKFSPDSSSIVFQRTTYGSPKQQPTTDIWIFQNGSQTILTASVGEDSEPDWSAPLSNAGVSGRVKGPSGIGIRSALVTITSLDGYRQTATTSSFGYYSFSNVPVGSSYTVAVQSRRFRFPPQTFAVNDFLTGIDFVGEE